MKTHTQFLKSVPAAGRALLLAALAINIVLPPVRAAAPELIAQWEAPSLPEGVAVDGDNNVYASFPYVGQIVKITLDGRVSVHATLPAPYGMAATAEGVLYIASTPMPGGDVGVYAVETDGTFEKLAGSENMVLPNAVALGEDGSIYATDSVEGSVWRFDGSGGEVWLRDPLLAGDGSAGFGVPVGANGITVHQRTVFVANSEQGQLVAIEINEDGSAGNSRIIAGPGLVGLEGVATDTAGNVYFTIVSALHPVTGAPLTYGNSVVRIRPPHSRLEVIADADDGLNCPANIASGHGSERRQLYLANFAAFPGGGAFPPSIAKLNLRVPPEVAANAHQWPLPNRDYASTRAVLDAGISARNVSRLTLAWSRPITSSAPRQWGIAACGPLILDNVVYFQNLQSDVQAIELATGALNWERRLNQGTLGPNGVAAAWGKVFGSVGSTSYSALDLADGTTVWSIRPGSARAEVMLVPPIPYDGAFYLGTDGNTAGVTGRIYAFDPETREELWSFAADESGNAWGNRGINFGAGIWMPVTVDLERDLIFAGVGNVYPYPGTGGWPNGSSRPGPNLYSNSMLALDRRTGELKWFNQVAPHDLFDHDFHITPVLATVRIGGADRDIVIGAGKLGRVIAFDRDTGEKLWDTPVGRHLNDDLTELPPGETLVIPGGFGGVVTPIAYAEGVVFAPVANRGDRFSPTALLTQSTGVPPLDGDLTALDAATGEILWNVHFDSMALGGATVVDDLVFTATLDGMIYALDRATGEERWKYQAPGGINAWPAVAGDTLVWPVGFGRTPQLIALRLRPLPPTEWVQVQTPPASTPPDRAFHGMVYDSLHRVVLLHGGASSGDAVRDTWAWDGENWVRLSQQGPAAFAFGWAFDSGRGVAVLHGGLGNGSPRPTLEATWEWDGETWKQVSASGGPGLRAGSAMAYDPQRKRVLLHGGSVEVSGNTILADTWQWDGTSWQEISDAKGPPRAQHQMAYDEKRQVMVLFGGFDVLGSGPVETWEFDGTEWRQAATDGPPGARQFPILACDPLRQAILLFGGGEYPPLGGPDYKYRNDVWEWDGEAWSEILMEGTRPTPVIAAAGAYDPRRGRWVRFGGTTDFPNRVTISETWEYGVLPLRFGGIGRQGGELELHWGGGAPPYQVQSCSDLTVRAWQNEGEPTNAGSATVSADGAAKFFRVLSLFGDTP
jgi:outer membrane protein assembly factor BamB